MRVVIAPGSFGGALSAAQAAEAIAAGWARRAPADDLVLAPVSDAGEGYVAVLQVSLGGELLATTVPSATGAATPACILVVGDTAYVEAGQAVGQAATKLGDTGAEWPAERMSSVGVGELVARALAAGATRLVVGVGRSGVASNDGGAGLLAALGASSEPDGALTRGSTELGTLLGVDVTRALDSVAATRLVLSTDDDSTLLGLLGTTNAAGRARGITDERIPIVDARLERLADLVGRRTALVPGAGAGGGVGFGLLSLGASRAPGLRFVMAEIRLAELASRADLVVTGEEAFDLGAGSGHVVTGVAALAGSAVRPCIALAERVAVGAREARALGVESAYSVADLVGADPGGRPERLAALAERVARTWSWSR